MKARGVCSLFLLVAGLAAQTGLSQTFTTLYSFEGGNEGAQPQAGLVVGQDGSIYSTTVSGGAFGMGTVFQLTPPATEGAAWTETVLYSFQGPPGDGNTPYGMLLIGANGDLYGTTTGGGAKQGGIVFQLSPPQTAGGAWSETVLHNFPQPAAFLLYAGVIADANGTLYGDTFFGGVNGGTVFTLSPATPWIENTIYELHPEADGAQPQANLAWGPSGVLYGTASIGGKPRMGTVFELAPPQSKGGSWTETTLHEFTGPSDAVPTAPVLVGASGQLYGTTSGGNSTHGTVFELTRQADGTWSETILHNFADRLDGVNPYAGLVPDSSGALYGVTYLGGAANRGTVFKLTPPGSVGGTWAKTTLHNFTGRNGQGSYPYGGLVFGYRGALYGTTDAGGASGNGTVFALK